MPPRPASIFERPLPPPRNLGEAKHLLANQSDIHYWLGCALAALGEKAQAREHWLAAADVPRRFPGNERPRLFRNDLLLRACLASGSARRPRRRNCSSELLAYARKLQKTPAKIDYFATSLPTMLLFDDDIQFRQETTALFLQAQARLGLGQKAKAKSLLKTVLNRDPNHALAADLLEEI